MKASENMVGSFLLGISTGSAATMAVSDYALMNANWHYSNQTLAFELFLATIFFGIFLIYYKSAKERGENQ